ncbi:hypothetical protein E2C01_041310 [Portunus trituberculatus]|uniref:Uncharacterized protein n=1 Tax=Portunus trituberculatus TaxID=210409 RepID=A0A5B7FIX0_PORTR|nr:hypothetical protein [Portunus trituberculatus]
MRCSPITATKSQGLVKADELGRLSPSRFVPPCLLASRSIPNNVFSLTDDKIPCLHITSPRAG